MVKDAVEEYSEAFLRMFGIKKDFVGPSIAANKILEETFVIFHNSFAILSHFYLLSTAFCAWFIQPVSPSKSIRDCPSSLR